MVKIQKRAIDGIELTTFSEEINSANILEVEAGTTGFRGGDSGHGARTYFRLIDLGGTDISVKPINDDLFGNGGVTIELSGDTEISTFIEALEFAVSILKYQSNYNEGEN